MTAPGPQEHEGLPSPSPRKRLPRRRRVPGRAPFALTKRDLEILRTVDAHRLVTSAHIQALTDGSNQGVLRRLQKLFHNGHLDRISRSYSTEVNPRMVYAITNKGVGILQKEGLIEKPTRTDWNAQNRDLHGYSIEHTLLISHVRSVLALACSRTPGVKLTTWREGASLYDAVEVAVETGYARVPVAPDAFFGLEEPKGRLHFFLEADRGTMTVARFARKLAAYAAYWRLGRHREKYGIRYFRVLTVTSGPKRKRNLVAAARAMDCLKGLERLFLFTNEASLSLNDPASIFGRVWTSTADGGHGLLPGAPSAQTTEKDDGKPIDRIAPGSCETPGSGTRGDPTSAREEEERAA